MKNIILGNGEVGNAIKNNLINNVTIYDKGEWETKKFNKENILLHICMPYTKDFIKIIKKAIKNIKPEITIIHSTIKPYTIKKIKKNNILYSPIRGRHSNEGGLSESIKNFKKYFAGKKENFNKIKNEFELECEYWGENTPSLVFGKIASTNYFYWNIIYEKFIHYECKKNNWDFDKVYTKMNKTYNEGYGKTNPEFIRPILKHYDNTIPGGHCLLPNSFLWNDGISICLQLWHKLFKKNK